MEAFGSWLSGLLLSLTGAFTARVLAALGISFVTFKGLDSALDWCKDLITQHIAALPPSFLNIMSLLRIGEALTIIISCYVAAITLNGISAGGVLKKMIWG